MASEIVLPGRPFSGMPRRYGADDVAHLHWPVSLDQHDADRRAYAVGEGKSLRIFCLTLAEYG